MPRKSKQPAAGEHGGPAAERLSQQAGAAIYSGLGSPALAENHAAQIAAAKPEPKNHVEYAILQQGGVKALEEFRARKGA